jgi:BirA family transcriptional regulator, biotin operon repressor / biotin---[acetyl-CoA-carboxylase] ligase
VIQGFRLADVASAWRRSGLDFELVGVDRIDSTQRLARVLSDRFLDEDEPVPTVLVLALEQSAGRGRRGRAWISGRGCGLWATLVLQVALDELPTVPMRAATALAEALREFGASVRLKWPNDLVAGRRKLGGLLVEASVRADQPAAALTGFGINLRSPEVPIDARPAFLGELLGESQAPGLAEVAIRCTQRLADELQAEREDWLDRYRELSAHAVGDRVRCELGDGALDGEFAGFDPRGFLRLDTAAGPRVISSGEIYSW